MPPSPARDGVIPPALARGRPAAVLASSAVAVGLWAGRAALAGPLLEFLPWNLFLAAIPWLAAHVVARAGSRLALASAGALWLAFLPNAPYLVTDLVHLRPRPPAPHSLDVLLFAAFALAGAILGWESIALVHGRLVRALGRARAGLTVAAVMLLAGFGVYLGRFQRWNTWDLVLRPDDVLADAFLALGSPRALAYSAAFAAVLGAGYLAFAPAAALRRGRARAASRTRPVRGARPEVA